MIDWSNYLCEAMEAHDVPAHEDGYTVTPEEIVELEELRDYVNHLLKDGRW